MRDKEIVDLWEAYAQVHEQETSRGPRLTDTYDKWDNEDAPKSGYKPVKKLSKMKGVVKKEEVDIILSHLLDEGYAETSEAAEKIMANMSEEWRDSIVEMSDFAAGGGNAKMKQTGMSKAEVEALGKKNLAKKPTTSGKTSEKSSSENSTPEKKVKYGELVSKPGEPKRYSPHGEVTASHKFHSYNQSRDRADDIASWKGLNRKDPAVQAKLKKWADTNYRQNIAMDTNDPNYDPTKTSYPKF